MNLTHSRHQTKNSFFIIGFFITFVIWCRSIVMFVNRIIILYCSIIIITFRLCQTCVRGIIRSDFVMYLMQYLFSLYIYIFYSLFIYTYYILLKKILWSRNVFKFFFIVYINKLLILYNNHLMLVCWPSYFSLLCITRAIILFIYIIISSISSRLKKKFEISSLLTWVDVCILS